MRVLRPIAVLFASLLALSAPAQTHKTARPEQVTRAVGVYEWTGPIGKPTASRLVPVTIFLDGHLEDASVFLARPVPLALQTGVIYSIEHAGEHLGTVDLDSARNVGIRAPASEDATVSGWFGYGRFTPPAAEPKPKPVSTASTPSAIVSTVGDSGDDPRPHYTVRQPAAATPDTKAPDAKSAPRAAVDDDDDRPTLRRRDADDDKKKKPKKESGSGVIGPKTSLNDDPDRPTMRRGAPESAQFTPALSGLPKDLEQAVAVSDAKARAAHDFARSWESPAEHDETFASLQKLARARVEAYLKTNALRPATAADIASPSPTQPDDPARPVLRRGVPVQPHEPVAAKHGRSSAAAPALTLLHEDLHGYTLSYGGLPTFVYTAQAPVAGGGTVYVTLVTQRLPTGELQVSLVGVTDAQHLDRSPWMRLVDAVDVDAGNRASLLFELRAQTGRQFALYRLVTAQAEQSFLGSVLP